MVSFGGIGWRCTPLRGPDVALRLRRCHSVFCPASCSPPPSGPPGPKKPSSAGGNAFDFCPLLLWACRSDRLSFQLVELCCRPKPLAGRDDLLELLPHHGGDNCPAPAPPGGVAPAADPLSRGHRLPLSQLLERLSFPGEYRDVSTHRLFRRPALAAWDAVALHTSRLSGLSEHRDHPAVHRPGHRSGRPDPSRTF